MTAAVEDIIATVGTWLAVVLALVALIGVITPYLILKATSSDRARALRAIDSADTGYIWTKLKLSSKIQLQIVNVPLLTSRPGLENGPKLRSKVGGTAMGQRRPGGVADEEQALLPEETPILSSSSTSWIVLAHLTSFYSDNFETGDPLILRGSEYWFPMHRFFLLAVGLRGRYGKRQHFAERLDTWTTSRMFTELSDSTDERYYHSSPLMNKLYGTTGTLWWIHHLDRAETRFDEVYYAPHIYTLTKEDLVDPVPLDELFWLAIGCLPIRDAQGKVQRVYNLLARHFVKMRSVLPMNRRQLELNTEGRSQHQSEERRSASQDPEDRGDQAEEMTPLEVWHIPRLHTVTVVHVEADFEYEPGEDATAQQGTSPQLGDGEADHAARTIDASAEFTPRQHISAAHREWAEAMGASAVTHNQIYYIEVNKIKEDADHSEGPRLVESDRQRMTVGLLRLTISPRGFLAYPDRPLYNFFQDSGRVASSDFPAVPGWTARAFQFAVNERWLGGETLLLRTEMEDLRWNMTSVRDKETTFSRELGSLCYNIDKTTTQLLNGDWDAHHVAISVLIFTRPAFRKGIEALLTAEAGDNRIPLSLHGNVLRLGEAEYSLQLEDEFLHLPPPQASPRTNSRWLRALIAWRRLKPPCNGSPIEMAEQPQAKTVHGNATTPLGASAVEEDRPRQTLTRQDLWLMFIHSANRLVWSMNHVSSKPLLETVNKMSATVHISPSMSVPLWSSAGQRSDNLDFIGPLRKHGSLPTDSALSGDDSSLHSVRTGDTDTDSMHSAWSHEHNEAELAEIPGEDHV